MKILAFSDLHRDVKAARSIVEAAAGADVLVGAGDFANHGRGAADTIEILRAVEVPVVFVAGNHDNSGDLRELSEDWRNGHFLDAQAIEIDGVAFFGLGGEIPRRNTAKWNEFSSEEGAARALTACPGGGVLVTHSPPFGCGDVQHDGEHEGSRAIRFAIEQARPALCLCGHIHFSWGAYGRIGATHVNNLGPTLNWFEL